MWAEAPHQGLARSEFRAFYHPPESPLFPNHVLIGNWIELTLLASLLRPSMGWPAVSVTTKPRDIRQLASECSQILAGVYYVVTLAT